MSKENWDIIRAKYVASAVRADQYPPVRMIEAAFIGRSNVGKSSLINSLCRRNGLARVSATPGKTQTINFYELEAKRTDEGLDERAKFYLVDLPGYGYAKRSKKVQEQLDRMIRTSILQREQLVNLFVLIDIRHDPQKIDREFIDWLGLSQIPFSIIFTKADKLSGGRARANAKAWIDSLLDTWETPPPYFVTSSEAKTGRQEVLDYIDDILKKL